MAILTNMASTPKIKATYSLDPGTVRLLERMSRKLGIPKSEALRRAILGLANQDADSDPRRDALDRAQRLTALTTDAAAAWERRNRAERRASSRDPARGR